MLIHLSLAHAFINRIIQLIEMCVRLLFRFRVSTSLPEHWKRIFSIFSIFCFVSIVFNRNHILGVSLSFTFSISKSSANDCSVSTDAEIADHYDELMLSRWKLNKETKDAQFFFLSSVHETCVNFCILMNDKAVDETRSSMNEIEERKKISKRNGFRVCHKKCIRR